MGRWMEIMERMTRLLDKKDGPEEFGLDCHDLSVENIFVDEDDYTSIVSKVVSILYLLGFNHVVRPASSTGNQRRPDRSGPAPMYLPSFNPVPSSQRSSGMSSPN
jgi:hypothetical protein